MASDEVPEALNYLSRSFFDERAERTRIVFLLGKFPNITPKAAWWIMPFLFSYGVLDAANLKALTYSDFLQTAYWQAVVWKVKQRDPWCQSCERSLGEMHVHHSTYRHRGSEWEHLEDLVLLCEQCHKIFHRKQSAQSKNGGHFSPLKRQ